jgi:hypothetical protein
MPWTWDEIDADWLGGEPIADDPDVAAAAFNRIDAVLGAGWVDAYRTRHGGSGRRGQSLTLSLVTLGKQLRYIEDSSGCEGLVRRLRSDQPGARAELEGISLFMASPADVRLECEPLVLVSSGARKADFRVAEAGDEWIYVEVTQPDRSVPEKNLCLAMAELTDVVRSVDGSYAVELFFLISPTLDELREMRPLLKEVCGRDEKIERDLPDGLGRVYIGQTPGMIVIDDHGYAYTPGLGRFELVAGPTSTRHIAVRVPFFDRRAHNFLANEASQLPDNGPGLIMIEMSRATGGMKKWAPILREELQLETYENVSAICLFKSTSVGTERVEAGKVQSAEKVTTVLVGNSRAAHKLPAWATAVLSRHERAAGST